ncbi:nuclear transport factor 2 family protein [Cryptosporangium phraense]|uniref:Nuclear transport factor 2 family protein n=1 Tax=Cryptosporangium phraense TaxID=2593070 RepID=A0A545AMM4_9ACTN|nr:nuclear transport factor 2 family protein [Cryptosporangium phraense]TQS42510.1 nuclear transport factor 2 family protein [Cryptosporangium phraense]
MSDLIERYLAVWNEADPEARRAKLAQDWAEDVTLVDPLVDVQGRDAIDATIAGVREQFDGLVFTPVGTVDAHHGVARFRWGLGPAGAEPLAIGFDVVTLDAEGRIKTVVGFFDKLPAT